MSTPTSKSKNFQTLLVSVFLYIFLLGAFVMTRSMLKTTALFPRMIIVIFALINTIMVIQSIQGEEKKYVNLKDCKMPLLYFTGIIVYIFLFRLSNYFVATTVMLIAHMLLLKVRPIWMIPIITVVYSGFVYVLFVFWLNTSII